MAGFFFLQLQTLFKYLCCTRVWNADHFSELSGNLCPFQGEQGRDCTSGLRGKMGVLKALSAVSEVPHFHSILILNLCLRPVWTNRIFFFLSADGFEFSGLSEIENVNFCDFGYQKIPSLQCLDLKPPQNRAWFFRMDFLKWTIFWNWQSRGHNNWLQRQLWDKWAAAVGFWGVLGCSFTPLILLPVAVVSCHGITEKLNSPWEGPEAVSSPLFFFFFNYS